jgi:hypothetical protein
MEIFLLNIIDKKVIPVIIPDQAVRKFHYFIEK